MSSNGRVAGREKGKGSPYGSIFLKHTKGWQDLRFIYLSATIALGLRLSAKGAQVGTVAERRGLNFCAFCVTRAKATWPLLIKLVNELLYVLLFKHQNYPMKFVPLYPFYR